MLRSLITAKNRHVRPRVPIYALGEPPFSFISLLPLETLAIIFQIVVENDERNQPLDLAIVCRKWRDAIYSHPRFWTNRRCSTSNPSNLQRSTGLVPHLQCWFERAGTLPLTLNLTITPTHLTPEELRALTAFLVQTTRWHSLHLKLAHDLELGRIWLNSLFSSCEEVIRTEGLSCWETLQKLEIDGRDVSVKDVRFPFATIAPNLRELKISLRRIQNATCLVQGFVNPKRLRRLEVSALICWVRDTLPRFWYHTLAQAINLEFFKVLDHHADSSLTATMRRQNLAEIASSFPVFNPTLTTLTVHDNIATKDCLGHLSLPALTSLTLVSTFAPASSSAPKLHVAVERLIAQSGCTIKHVRLENTPIRQQEIVAFLRLLTTLETLELGPSSAYRQRGVWH